MYEIAKGSIVRETIKEIEILKNKIKINDEYLENLIKNIYSSIGLKIKMNLLITLVNLMLVSKLLKKKFPMRLVGIN